MNTPLRRALIAGACAVALATRLAAVPPPTDAFDDLYARGQKANAAIKTLTARFTETSTSSLLTRPIVARGTVAVERPMRVVLRYTDPDLRTVLIDGNKMTMLWPSRGIQQVTDVGSAQGRVQKYFVNGSAADLRRQFEIDMHDAGDRPADYYVTMVPKRKQIRDALARLDLWVNRGSFLLDSMKLTFANGDTKTMAFEDVVPNAALPADAFALPR
jgi:outer membrane lipoprotein-sorting protein